MAAITDPTTALSPASVEAAGRDRLIQQVELLLRESGNNEPFDAAAAELYLNTPAGEALLSSLIGAMASGSYL